MDKLPPQAPAVNSWSPEYLENLYQQWRSNPAALDEKWQAFFQGFDLGAARDQGGSAGTSTPSTNTDGINWGPIESQIKVNSLIYHYRDVGHLMARLDPLGRERVRPVNLTLEAFDLDENHLDLFYRTTIAGVQEPMKLRDIITRLEQIYCGTLGAEYMHIQNTAERRWLQGHLEEEHGPIDLTREEKHNILRKLHQAEMFENFLHTRYVGQKRFSLEGAETLIPLLWFALESFAEFEVKEAVFGMAHRGRLNVLANIINKAYDDIFAEFQDNYSEDSEGGGDVKYHKGYSSNLLTTKGKLLSLTLAANPSHLEAVDPVVEGRTRAKQRMLGDTERQKVVPILIHGDAAFAGQGIVAETLQMVKLPGYSTGGTLHIIVNNQIGFTTDPASARSSVYCTDVAKMVQAPIFHINGEDIDTCMRTIRLAAEYRMRFNKDVIIDMWCYRKHGHNEGDEPAFTQPRMYETIRNKKPVGSIYAEKLKDEGIIDEDEIRQMQKDLEEVLEGAQQHGAETPVRGNQQAFRKTWDGFTRSFSFDRTDTTVPAETLKDIAERCHHLPEGFEPNSKVRRVYKQRRDSVVEGKPFDWGTAEMLAYGTLLREGVPVRLTGQDSRRGTFSHRHAVLLDVNTEDTYTPLNNIGEGQSRFCIYDSLLSEAAVVGFEYGYSLGDPGMLILWEAQFGDFANGAQTIIDQFIVSAGTKWERYSGLVMLLPHGYEGQGPEHSSARLERFLQLCADDNIQVVNLTSPAQYFHVIRRQMKRKFRKPLIVMSPKSLLRHPRMASTIDDLSNGTFHELIDDPSIEDRSQVSRVLLCSGKVYFDLIERREELGIRDTAIIRVEQLYPLHTEMLTQMLLRYPESARFYWCQEEPKNAGAWTFMFHAFWERMNIKLDYIGRPASASPAVGSKRVHDQELRELLNEALPAPAEVAATVS